MNFSLKTEFVSLNSDQRLYHLDIPIIGLTGGISTGKSTVLHLLEKAGFKIISADSLVKSIYTTEEAKYFVTNNFPSVIENNQINFKQLREIVFSDLNAKKMIENFVYSKLPDAFLNNVQTLKQTYPEMKCLMYEVPLLFERRLNNLVDLSVCIYLPRNTQKERLMKRDNISSELAEKILNEQLDIEQKKNKSKYIINNTGTLEDLASEVNGFIQHFFLRS